MKILGIIPARGGSKSIPKKNIKKLLGKPLIAWTIKEALASKIDRVIVTTDDQAIKKVALKYGAKVPFMRPEELTTDTIAIEPVIRHAIDWLKKNENYVPDGIALLMPPTPLKPAHHLNKMIEIFKKKKVDSVVAVREMIANDNPAWMLKRDDKTGKIKLYNGKPLKNILPRRQLLPVCYSRNDVAYIFKPKNLYEGIPNLYGDKIELYVMNSFYNIDINTLEDWNYCEEKLRRYQKLKKTNSLP